MGADYRMMARDLQDSVAKMAHKPTGRGAESVLGECPENLLAFIDHSPAVAFLKDVNGRMLYVNRVFERVFERPAMEFLGKTDDEIWPPEVARRFRENDLKVLATGEPLEVREQAPTPDGRMRSWLSFKFRVTGRDGEHYLGGMAVDISMHEEMEEALRHNEAKFRLLFEHSPTPIFVEDYAGTVLDVNPAACRLHGRNREELVGHSVSLLVPSAVRETVLARMKPLLKGECHQFESQSLHSDGHLIPVEVSVNPIEYEGRPSILLHVRDMTERKQAEERLRDAEAKYRELVEQLPAITYIAGFGGRRWDYVSPQIESLLGFTVAEWTGEKCPWLEQIHPDDRPHVLAVESRCGLTGAEFSAEYRMLARDGRVVWFSDHAVVVRDENGAPRHLHGVMFNITERKALEEQLTHAQKMDAIGRLAGGVAHDFNNILTTVLGYSELILRRAEADPRTHENALEIRKAADRAASLTRQLLAFSRKQTLQPQLLDLNVVVAEMDRMLRRLITETVHLDVRVAPGLWRVKADPGQIQQVIMNLAVNARDAMPQGGTLTIETSNVVLDEHYVRQHADAVAGQHVMLAVTDTGAGMTDDVRAHLFEPFFTTKGIGTGTGLGLATCYGIVKQSGGHINVYTELGCGTTFKVYLPRAHETIAASPVATNPAETPCGRERVLLVEDETPVRELSAHVLRELGYTVVEARDGDEALRLTREGNEVGFDLLFTDLVMPRMGGKELAYWFRLTHPRTRVLFTSGYPDKSVVHNGELVAGIAFLHKPYTPHVLAQKVREVLDN